MYRLFTVLPSLLLVAVACSAPAPVAAPASTAAPAASAAPTGTPAAPAAGLTIVVGRGSEVTVAVREQLAAFPAPNDAVLTTDGISGQATLKDDGTFTDGSKLEVKLDGLSSDSGIRDSYVKRTTLRTSQFPTAILAPTKVEGLSLPLPQGAFSFTLIGDMTISGVTKRTTWAVTGSRAGDTVTAKAVNAPAWKFSDFGLAIPRVASVISIVDEIRLVVNLQGELTETRSR